MVRKDPFQLARDIQGIGFVTADRIARSLNLPADHPSRILAGLVYRLREMIADGHVYTPRPLLEQKAAELLDLPIRQVSDAIDRAAEEGKKQIDPAAIVV